MGLTNCLCAQSVSYTPSANTYIVGSGISTLTPTSSGVGTLGSGTATTLTGTTFSSPTGVSADPSGNIYITNQGNGTVGNGFISKFNSTTAAYIGTFGTGVTMTSPIGIVFDSGGNAYVVDQGVGTGVGKVYKFNSSGVFQSTIVSGLNNAVAIAIDASNNLYVVDNGVNKVFKYSTAGIVGSPASFSIGLASPSAVTVDNLGNVYVVNSASTDNDIILFSSKGGTGSIFVTGLNNAHAIGIDSRGYIFVGNSGGNTINIYNQTGASVTTATAYDCEGIIPDINGNIYITSLAYNQAYKYTIQGGYYITTLPAGLSFNNSTGAISGTPTVSAPATNYVVTAYGASGSATATVNITVNYNQIQWKGVSTNWNTATNWSSGTVPTATDQVLIGAGSQTFTNNPTISTANTSVGSIIMGTRNSTAPILTVNGVTLTVAGDISFQSGSAVTTTIATLAGTGTINAGNLNITTATSSLTSAYTVTMASSVSNLTLSGNLIMTSTKNTNAQNSVFNLTSGVMTVNAIQTTNVAGSSSTITLGSGTTLNFTDENALINLSSLGANTLTVPASGTIGYTGNNDQTVYTDLVTNLAGGISYNNIVFSGSGQKTATAGNLNITGNFINFLVNDVNNFVDLTLPTVKFSGGTAQTLTGGSGNGVLFYNVTFGGTGTFTKTLSGTFGVAPTGVLTMVANTTLAAGAGLLTLNSDATGTASVAAIPSGASITGTVNVERYLEGSSDLSKRGYRLLSSPVYAAAINSQYAANVYDLNYLKGSVVTGLNGTTNGFNSGSTATGNASIYLFRQDIVPNNTSFAAGNFKSIAKLNNTPVYNFGINKKKTLTNTGDTTTYLPVGNGFLFFFRGNSTLSNGTTSGTKTTTPFNYPENTTLVQLGTLNAGNITVQPWMATSTNTYLSYTSTIANNVSGSNIRGYNLVGNPYPSTINWEKFNRQSTLSHSSIYGLGFPAAGTTATKIYIYNSTSKQYATYTPHTSISSVADTTTTIFTTSTYSSDGVVSNMIASGQAFFIVATGYATNTLTFRESAKTATQPAAVNATQIFASASPLFAAATDGAIRIKLVMDSVNTDAVVLQFNSKYSSRYLEDEDASDLGGNGALVSLSALSADNNVLTVDKTPYPVIKPQVTPLAVNATSSGTYSLKLDQIENMPANSTIWLKDNLKKDSLNMRTTPSYSFNIDNADTTTYGSNRFQVIIGEDTSLAAHLLQFNATKVTTPSAQVNINWNVVNEYDYTIFYVQRSIDNGKSFQVIDSLTSNGSGTYSYVDTSPAKGKNEYRLKTVDVNGTITYSNIIVIQFDGVNTIVNNINVYPNPAKDVINIAISGANTSGDTYLITIISSSGDIVKKTTSSQLSWQDSIGDLASGIYIIRVFDQTSQQLIGINKFIKI